MVWCYPCLRHRAPGLHCCSGTTPHFLQLNGNDEHSERLNTLARFSCVQLTLKVSKDFSVFFKSGILCLLGTVNVKSVNYDFSVFFPSGRSLLGTINVKSE